ncbi:MAG: SURF1 family protein [Caulobacter sp.]|nr:SURF1 family protein [Caulobacter sp.]
MKRFPFGLTIATLISLVILCVLGSWQLKRLAWKTDLLARIEALKTSPEAPLDQVLAAGGDVEFRRVRLSCPAAALSRQIELFGVVEGQPVRRLIVACPTATGTILVDEGYVAETVQARPSPPAGTVVISGILRKPDKPGAFNPAGAKEGLWYGRDIPAMARALGAENPAPVFLFAASPVRADWPALTPAPVPADIPNRHLEYALTWFGLAGALLAVYAAMLWRRFKAR